MIHDQDRSGYFGASDAKRIVTKSGKPTNHYTDTFAKWWEEKLGGPSQSFETKYTRAGTLYEHHILDAYDQNIVKDGQIIMDEYLLRVNYDGYLDGVIYEVKTHHIDKAFNPMDYYWQCQVEMFVYKEMCEKWFLPPFQKLVILSYPLYEEEYNVLWNEIEVDPNRIKADDTIIYNKDDMKTKFLPALKPLVKALKKGKFPG